MLEVEQNGKAEHPSSEEKVIGYSGRIPKTIGFPSLCYSVSYLEDRLYNSK